MQSHHILQPHRQDSQTENNIYLIQFIINLYMSSNIKW